VFNPTLPFDFIVWFAVAWVYATWLSSCNSKLVFVLQQLSEPLVHQQQQLVISGKAQFQTPTFWLDASKSHLQMWELVCGSWEALGPSMLSSFTTNVLVSLAFLSIVPYTAVRSYQVVFLALSVLGTTLALCKLLPCAKLSSEGKRLEESYIESGVDVQDLDAAMAHSTCARIVQYKHVRVTLFGYAVSYETIVLWLRAQFMVVPSLFSFLAVVWSDHV